MTLLDRVTLAAPVAREGFALPAGAIGTVVEVLTPDADVALVEFARGAVVTIWRTEVGV